MQKIKFFPVFLISAPFLLIYALMIVFLYINGVSGSDKWLKKLWDFSNNWSLIFALIAGMVAWGILIFKLCLS